MEPATALRTFNRVLHTLTQAATSQSRAVRVEIGSVLYMMERGAHQALVKLKETLQAEALQENPGNLTWRGSGRGQANINVPQPQLRIRKGADLEALRALLGDTFTEHFEVTTTYQLRKGAEKRLPTLPEATRKAVMSVCELGQGNPRVSFQRK
jgi:hypothetical protein